jgi:hypothetical protein
LGAFRLLYKLQRPFYHNPLLRIAHGIAVCGLAFHHFYLWYFRFFISSPYTPATGAHTAFSYSCWHSKLCPHTASASATTTTTTAAAAAINPTAATATGKVPEEQLHLLSQHLRAVLLYHVSPRKLSFCFG